MPVLPIWGEIGVAIYYAYRYRHSNVGRGIIEVPELSPEAPANVGISPLPGAPVPPNDRS
jgi:APA family basic amino acid/polyamine antiporter